VTCEMLWGAIVAMDWEEQASETWVWWSCGFGQHPPFNSSPKLGRILHSAIRRDCVDR
jgi:hypothetical protein